MKQWPAQRSSVHQDATASTLFADWPFQWEATRLLVRGISLCVYALSRWSPIKSPNPVGNLYTREREARRISAERQRLQELSCQLSKETSSLYKVEQIISSHFVDTKQYREI